MPSVGPEYMYCNLSLHANYPFILYPYSRFPCNPPFLVPVKIRLFLYLVCFFVQLRPLVSNIYCEDYSPDYIVLNS
ncbi:hypothetical protein WDU94_010321 [Cyamophila willieti]